ncbi:hypothetical protein LTR91_025081 [Friedmanniomyces endolithicus]|uniref:DUF427 domain-containing protein n=1 Tax=Friedmanniomyces endolithicus TaxID=329885 RepID=A0AAN6H0K3_9PEZI|nr:hypothetical protein LTR94_006759 [Friedmanniomyces endolithicus]KAK0792527.1 hypothetical protein LTR59_008528 [Friedmanniomyces endolithicus]KAK0803905.1 hypothetical protein LTR38_005963 [Friedmanniomyces endolithicus]KAK0814008.1 hypothetical protein LTR75_004463 [Friedmanniomyces endolithicus]KAK0866695.1 hypothetical protein LTS02_004658 [Friedmanniomyces endolithicus]
MDDKLKKLAIKLGTDGPHKTLPTPRMIKLLFNGSYILKTTHAHYVWEHPYYPHFYVPLAELQSTSSQTQLTISERETYHSPSDHKTILAHQLSLTVGTKSTSNVLSFPSTLTEGPAAPLAGLVRIDFDSLDAWFEEDTPIHVHPKDPFKRLDILSSTRPIRVLINRVLVAETSTSAHLYETGLPCRFYLPFSALLDPGVLRASATRTRCPYKGEAEYWSVEVGGEVYEDVIWYYRTPTMESAAVAGLVCFYNEKVDIELDGKMLERPDTHFGKSKPSENKKPSAV